MVDMCCDTVGGNANAPFYFSAYEDALQQSSYLLGKRILCNPVFHKIRDYQLFLENIFELDPSTKVLFIVPLRINKSNPWCKEMLEGGKWSLLEVYSRDSSAFSHPD